MKKPSNPEWIAIKKPVAGQHIRSTRGPYYHHGICVGDDQVIHFNGHITNMITRDDGASVRLTNLKGFQEGFPFLHACTDPPLFDVPTIIARAQSQLDNRGYDFFQNNCEHFCRWVTHDEHKSAQVERAWEVVASMVTVGVLTAAVTNLAKENITHTTTKLLDEARRNISEAQKNLDDAKKKLEISTEEMFVEAEKGIAEAQKNFIATLNEHKTALEELLATRKKD